jgi:hypothetical protein
MATTELYRYFSASGQLLYVGISGNAIKRLTSHKKNRWGDEIARLDIEKFPDRDAAKVAEQLAIISEMPLYNKRGFTGKYPVPRAQVNPHEEMHRLHRYLKGMKPAERIEFATRCGTKMSYFHMAISGGRRIGIDLAIRMTRESGGAFDARRLYPDLGFPGQPESRPAQVVADSPDNFYAKLIAA